MHAINNNIAMCASKYKIIRKNDKNKTINWILFCNIFYKKWNSD